MTADEAFAGDAGSRLSSYVIETVRKDDEFILYRGRTDSGAPTILVLGPASEHPAPATIRKLEHTYSLTAELSAEWAIRPVALTQHKGRAMLILEDPGGEPLDALPGKPMALTQFLRLGVGLSSALANLHGRGLIHKDIKPANVLVHSPTGRAWLMGFGIASQLPRERQSPGPPEFIAGTLPYMAPEQTGRMNRSIDSRSDLYSLGVTLYEMLTGSLPFTASDPMEWVHCHIARQPTPPATRLKDVPGSVSAIIMKLLAKTGEERYQTAAGIESDLRRCLAEWEARGRIDEFPPGEHDTASQLLIPEKLYGREREVEALLASFDRVVKNGTPELVLISGYSGIGKSSVVHELHKSLVLPRGLFASGKFDQYKRDIPYATLAQAFQSLIRPLLSRTDAELSNWREALREALGPNGLLMTDLVPELKLIVGEQPPVPELPPQDEQRRFHLVFRRFIAVFARPEHPLALFLDDLQWLDTATLDILDDLLIHPDVRHLMLTGAYRDNEVDSSHPLMHKLRALRKAGAIVHEITLTLLTREDLRGLIADSLRCEPERTTELAQLVHDKTAGNPFFAIQFLSALAGEGLLTFDHGKARWFWDLNRIRAKGYTDNVADLMVARLHRLPNKAQEALQEMACLGNIAAIPTLSLVRRTSQEEVHKDLWEAVSQGLIESLDGFYRFVHDRVQEAAYSLIPEELRPETHFQIGRLLAAHIPAETREEAIFEIVNHLNRGAALITTPEEREQLAELNLIAGKRAKASTAYVSALHYLNAGAALLADDRWERQHQLAFPLELHRAECEFLTGELAVAEERLAALSTPAVNALERAAVACLRMTLYTTLDRSDRGVEVGLEYLRGIGVSWSPHPTKDEVRQEYERLWQHLGSRPIESITDLPRMSDPDLCATLHVLMALHPSAMYTDLNLHALVVGRMANISLEHGNEAASCHAYVWVGFVVATEFGNYQAGFRFGRMALDLVEKSGLDRFKAHAYMGFAVNCNLWGRHARTSLDLIRRAFTTSQETGELMYLANACACKVMILLLAGNTLTDVQLEVENGIETAQKTRFGLVVDALTAQLRFILTLRGLTPVFGSFNNADFDESSFERRLDADPHPVAKAWYWNQKLQARFYAGDYVSAMAAASQIEPLLWIFITSLTELAGYHFYGALARTALHDASADDERPGLLEAVRRHYRQLEVWAENCPENFENRRALVGAEIARIEGRELDAERLYEKAIKSAHENGFVHNEALAYEHASAFYRARGFDQFADTYLHEARACYASWGADGKVRQLDRLYPGLKQEQPLSGPAATITAPLEGLDLATVIRVSQAVSSEIVLEKLFDTVMRKAMEHAGAERGLLILPHGDELKIEAESSISGNDVIVCVRDTSAAAAAMPESILRYVMRTQESVILDDASSANPFSSDPYFLQNRVRSILCLPLLNQAKLSGVLYLENNLAPRVFTSERITVLRVLVSQAAISLENTRLYRDLEDREAKIRRLVEADVVGIVMWNLQGAITGANDAFLHMVGYDREDLASGRVRWTDLTPPEWRDEDDRAIAELKENGVFQPCEKEYFRKDGSRVPILIGGAFFEDSKNDGVAFIIDLSEQKRAEAEIRLIVNTIPALAWSARADGFAEFFNQHYIDYVGLSAEQVSDWDWTAAVHPDDLNDLIATWQRIIASGQSGEAEARLRRCDGEYRWFLFRMSPLRDEKGNILKWYGINTDIDDRRRAENLRLEERVNERTRIARELHDTLLQSFQGLLMKFSSLKYVIASRPTEAVELLEGTIEQARAAIVEGRNAVQGLRSSTVVVNDLARTIATFAEGLASDQNGENRPEFRVRVEGKSSDIHPIVRDEVYHIACESLRNAFRHAHAKRVEVELRYDPRQFRLRVVDNGKGIDPAVLSAGRRAGHFGLTGIRERAELAGGKLSVLSQLDSGTEIELTIPASIAYLTSERRSISAEKRTE